MDPEAPPAPDPAECSPEEYLVWSLRWLEYLAARADQAQSFTAAVNAKNRAVAMRAELDQRRETQRQLVQVPDTLEAHRAEALSEVRRLRIGATQAGSYVAAGKLLEMELGAINAIAALAEGEEAEALREADLADLEAELEELRAKRLG